MNRPVLVLRVAYLSGASLDFYFTIEMCFRFFTFQGDPYLLDRLGVCIGLDLAWTLLLLWANLKPLERMFVLPLTCVIVVTSFIAKIFLTAAEVLPLSAESLFLTAGSLLIAVFFMSAYWYAKKSVRNPEG